MDAKVDGWVVTPRRGKAVEINALWFNALALMGDWARELDQDRRSVSRRRRARRRCVQPAILESGDWLPLRRGGRASGRRPKIRPNQIFAISLTHRCSTPAGGESVLRVAQELPLPPRWACALLSPHDPDFKPTYDVDLRARDAAYHQGTVWPWLLGHYVDAWLKLPPRAHRRPEMVRGLENELSDGLPRAGERDLRRHGALPSAGLLRPGLERRRGAPGLAGDGLILRRPGARAAQRAIRRA
jgi:glycogen debranching enzyme